MYFLYMLGGGAGSVIHMIITLRNNQKMLFGKRRYFKGPFHRSELAFPKRKKPILNHFTALEPKKNHDRILQQKKYNKRHALIFALLAAIVSVVTIVVFNSILSHSSQVHKSYNQKADVIIYSALKKQPYKENMILGIENLKAKQYFMAIGNFERAISANPTKKAGHYFLAKAYCKLCVQYPKSCNQAKSKLKLGREKFNQDADFLYLQKKYNSYFENQNRN